MTSSSWVAGKGLSYPEEFGGQRPANVFKPRQV